MTTALVTGGSGFIGGHLVEVLVQRGVQVRCLVRRPQACAFLEHSGAELIQGDVTQPNTLPAAFAGVDVVYHVAGLLSARHRDDFTNVNRGGAYNVAQACAAQRNPPVHVLVSSMAAAGPTSRGTIRTEADPATPISIYGRSKRQGELAAQEFASSVPTTIVRPGIVFGERSLSMAPMFDVIERSRIHPHPGFVSPPLTLLYVKDLVEILLLATERGERLPAGNFNEGTACQGIYFAGRDEFPTYRDFGHMIGRALGHSRVLVLPLPWPIPWIAAAVSQTFSQWRGVPATFNIDRIREVTATSWACSSACAQQHLGFAPRQSLQEQLATTANWYRENGLIGKRPVFDAIKQMLKLFQPRRSFALRAKPHHRAGA